MCLPVQMSVQKLIIQHDVRISHVNSLTGRCSICVSLLLHSVIHSFASPFRLAISFVHFHCWFGMHSTCFCMRHGKCAGASLSTVQLHYLLSILVFCHLCGQALERQKEYFDCIRNERDELRHELADLKEMARSGEVGHPAT